MRKACGSQSVFISVLFVVLKEVTYRVKWKLGSRAFKDRAVASNGRLKTERIAHLGALPAAFNNRHIFFFCVKKKKKTKI